ncbi:Ig-like domain-containing protein [Arthrobacter sp. Marseille-P9274]|uniref:Ig-like domain-containing protein n=1 Tax=Arthrobacter sp. Marseille-P9274 TaxID=2866572 RepID=UPI0021C6E0AB|nr:Ig-like domain-containing protein [Arthrobacter sp. Marseille-P9274]
MAWAGASSGSLACPPGFEALPGCSADTSSAGAVSSGSRVEFRAGGQLLGTDSAAPYSWSWDTSGQPNGAATVTATAVDRAGRNAVAAANVVVNNDQDALYCGSASNAEHKAKGRAVSYGTNPYNPYYAQPVLRATRTTRSAPRATWARGTARSPG